MWYTFRMRNTHLQNLGTVFACLIALIFIVYAIIFAHRAPKIEPTVEIDSASVHIRSKLISYTDGPFSFEEVLPKEGDEAWTRAVNTQLHTYMSNISTITKIPSDPNVFVYKLDYIHSNNSVWVTWYDDGGTAPLTGNDITVALPMPQQQEGIVLTERIIQKSETEPLVRGYQVENGEVKFTITRIPVFVYSKEE